MPTQGREPQTPAHTNASPFGPSPPTGVDRDAGAVFVLDVATFAGATAYAGAEAATFAPGPIRRWGSPLPGSRSVRR